MTSANVETAEQLVVTTEQAAEILGVQRQSILNLIKGKNESMGKKVVWHKGEDGNPLPSVPFILIAYVQDLARVKGRMSFMDNVTPIKIHFPVVPTEQEYDPTPVGSEKEFRQQELIRLTESAIRESHAHEVRCIEVERDEAQRQLHEARAEAERLRNMVAACVGAV